MSAIVIRGLRRARGALVDAELDVLRLAYDTRKNAADEAPADVLFEVAARLHQIADEVDEAATLIDWATAR
ncbi:MAG TPA: hypothetical protein VEF72_05835 [Mycobacterium sp.]|nr:hypothetical protein [Mycobacterium sp.]